MFCLRSWIPILFFLTNASPIYLILFISATYVLNRPCVYCSLLLAILVLALFDFGASTASEGWFEPRYSFLSSSLSTTSGAGQNATASAVESAASLLGSVVSATADAVVDGLVGVGKRGMEGGGAGWQSWMRRLWRSGLHIDCLGVVVRL